MKVEARCPCCNQHVEPTKILVSLDTDELILRGQKVKLSPKAAEVAFVLASVFPRAIDIDRMIPKVWGITPPDGAVDAVKSHIGGLRKSLAPLGVGVEYIPNGNYRFVVTTA